MYKRILIPLDGSPLAEQALPHAVALAEHFHSELILLRVLIPLPSPPTTTEAALQRATEEMAILAREYLDRVAASAQELGGPDCDVHTRAIRTGPLVVGQRL
jgi:nucleotide-binding universal stress UspA family protein